MSVRVLTGDCREVLATLPEKHFHTVVTSPPYFGLRDYGVEGQIGLEPTPDEFVAALVAVFREVRRVLRDDGTVWLNLGDSYAGSGRGGNPDAGTKQGTNRGSQTVGVLYGREHESADAERSRMKAANAALMAGGLKPKDLIGIPWMVAFALRADGWVLRQEIIWSKPNPMPESVRDRCTKAHESLFLLSKEPRYYFDQEAIREPIAEASLERLSQPTLDEQDGSDRVPGKTNGAMKAAARPQLRRAIELAKEKGLTAAHFEAIRACGITDVGKAQHTQSGFGKNTPEMMRLAAEAKEALGGYYREFVSAGRNRRSVWTITTQPYSEAHFATFPPALVEPCIKAGCPSGGHVLDPFAGAGTTGLVADRLQRNATLIELNPAYADMARARLAKDGGLFAEVAAE